MVGTSSLRVTLTQRTTWEPFSMALPLVLGYDHIGHQPPAWLLGRLPVLLLALLSGVWLMMHSTTPPTRLKGALTRAPELAHHLYLTHCMAA